MARQAENQKFRVGDSYVNLLIGVIVVIAIAAVVFGLIRRGEQPIQPGEETEKEETSEGLPLPLKHTVGAGEDLWKISEKYYKTGYNWVDIARENKLANPNAIVEGMELTIPNVTPMVFQQEMAQAPAETPTPMEIGATPVPTISPQADAISGTTYTVVQGDNLWRIALRAYGDGYKWVDIARANKLENPDIIHRGNVLTIPR